MCAVLHGYEGVDKDPASRMTSPQFMATAVDAQARLEAEVRIDNYVGMVNIIGSGHDGENRLCLP